MTQLGIVERDPDSDRPPSFPPHSADRFLSVLHFKLLLLSVDGGGKESECNPRAHVRSITRQTHTRSRVILSCNSDVSIKEKQELQLSVGMSSVARMIGNKMLNKMH